MMCDTRKATQPQVLENEKAQEPKRDIRVMGNKETGMVKWFNVKRGIGIIIRNDGDQEVFVHYSAIARNNPRKVARSLGDGESVEFVVVAGEKGLEAAEVTGPGGKPVRGSPFAANKRRVFRRKYCPRQSGCGDEIASPGTDKERREPPVIQLYSLF